MQLEGKDGITIIGYVIGWAGTVFAFGRMHGNMSARQDSHERELMMLRDKEIKRLHEAIDKLHACFVTADGEPRLMSFSAHDKIRAECRSQLDDRHSTYIARMTDHDVKLGRILEELAAMRSDIKNGGKQ